MTQIKQLIGLALLLLSGASQAQICRSEPVEVWRCTEIALESADVYDHPVRDVDVRATFTHAQGDTLSISGFWDGGRTWRLRPSFPLAGRWTWRTESTDAGLGGQSGSLDVSPTSSEDPYRIHGWPRVSHDRRSLTYADGQPLFYLADTPWEAGWASTLSEIDQYVEDRRAKRFNAVQIVVNSHQFNYPEHIVNRDGRPYLINQDRSRPNPRYFDHLDEVVGRANRAGLMVALVPLWATYASAHVASTNHVVLYSPSDAVLHARYVGARYAGANVMWIVGGDQAYNTPERRAYWDAFARTLKRSSGGNHLATVHPGGYTGSFDSWPVPPDWLDFHMYQASHFASPRYERDSQGQMIEDVWGSPRAEGGYVWAGALTGYHQTVPAPVLNAEANYENLFAKFWEFTADTTGGTRIDAVDVRQTAYWGLLSGSNVGFAYGANGVWQWAHELGGGFWVSRDVMDALRFPGASQMARVREIAEANDWSRWVPRPDLAVELGSPQFVAAALGPDRLVAYLPVGTTRFGLAVPSTFGDEVRLTWWSTTSEERIVLDEVRELGVWELEPPGPGDWVLVMTPLVSSSPSPVEPASDRLSLRHAGSNPGPSGSSVVVSSGLGGPVKLVVLDALGRQVYATELVLHAGETVVGLPDTASGVYVCRVTASAPDGTVSQATLRLTVAR